MCVLEKQAEMSEQRLSDVEDQVQDLEIRQAELAVEIRHMTAVLDKLSDNVNSLTSAMDRGKGALWVFGGISSAVGALLTIVISNFFGRGS